MLYMCEFYRTKSRVFIANVNFKKNNCGRSRRGSSFSVSRLNVLIGRLSPTGVFHSLKVLYTLELSEFL